MRNRRGGAKAKGAKKRQVLKKFPRFVRNLTEHIASLTILSLRSQKILQKSDVGDGDDKVNTSLANYLKILHELLPDDFSELPK